MGWLPDNLAVNERRQPVLQLYQYEFWSTRGKQAITYDTEHSGETLR